MSESIPALERRFLVLSPLGRDAQLTQSVLGEAGIRATVCPEMPHLVRELAQGAGGVLLSEEALLNDVALYGLGELLARQQSWSDLPILLLARPGADSPCVRRAVRTLGNVTLLERPVRLAALVTAAQTALRARQRQYLAREHLTELDDTAKALGESESRLNAIFANAAVGIAEIDSEGRFSFANDALCQLLGERRDRLLTRTLPALSHPDDRPAVESEMRDVLRGVRELHAGERRFMRRDGEVFWVKLSVSAVKDRAGLPSRAVAVVEDINEQKHAEEDLREADRRKDEFLATLAHELRNPLAPIRNSLHIFRLTGVQDPAVDRVTAMMERQVAHMVRMVDDLLEVSRISRGKIELRCEPVQLAEVLRNAVDTSLPLIEAAKHRLTTEFPDEPLVVHADPVRLAQVFANLLNNAAKYTPEGGEIRISVRAEGGLAVVCVKDNGEGIPKAMLSRVFNMFTQVNTGARAQGGLGIGLTLARTLVLLHGGSIEAASPGSDQGCEFIVKLPLVGSAADATEEPTAKVEQSHAPLRRVLVVDDNHDAADSLGMLLEFLGAEVQVVHDGAAALEALKSFRPTVVLLDLGMPNMSGLEVARRMRADPEVSAVTLVALTGWGQKEDRRKTTEAGFDYHLVKPADLGVLQGILSNPASASQTRH